MTQPATSEEKPVKALSLVVGQIPMEQLVQCTGVHLFHGSTEWKVRFEDMDSMLAICGFNTIFFGTGFDVSKVQGWVTYARALSELDYTGTVEQRNASGIESKLGPLVDSDTNKHFNYSDWGIVSMRQIAFGAGLDMKVVVSARLMDEPPRDLLVGIGSNQEVLFVSAVEVNLQVAFPTFPSIVALFR